MSDLPYTKKQLGQHWLEDAASLEAIVHAAGVQTGDTVLEIGPGAGTLTSTLLDKGALVTALEYDNRLLNALRQRFIKLIDSQLTVIEGDIRQFDLGTMTSHYKIVANIPYYLTANLMRKLVDDNNKPEVAAILVQKEVAERIAAGRGQRSFISIAMQLYYDISLGALVPAKLFRPPPKVDSQVLKLQLRSKPLFENLEAKPFLGLVKAGFSAPRKKLRSSLSGGLGVSKDAAELLLAAAHIDPNARAQELSMQDWYALYQTQNKSPSPLT